MGSMFVATLILFGSIPLALLLSGIAASQSMKRWNSRAIAIAAGSLVGVSAAVAGTFTALNLAPQEAWHGGGMFAFGMAGIFGAGFCFIVGGLVAAFIAFGSKMPEDSIWSSEEGDRRGYRSKSDDERYG